ncbi:MAG: ECF transporter S component [Ruminococcaceae bacterium]|nr:ECF transporter S component [Oscillospiraceae bacterium]
MNSNKQKARNIAVLGMFAAVTVVFQLLSYAIKIGTFNLSLVLIPIVLGAYLYGVKTGAVLGGVFGVVVTICCFAGLDGGGYILVTASPFLTSAVCIIKGIAAGVASALVAKALKGKNEYLAIILAALTAPVVNTGIFVAAMFVFFKDILASWAGGANVVTYAITGLVGVNFIIEFTINAVMAPSLLRVTKAIKKI